MLNLHARRPGCGSAIWMARRPGRSTPSTATAAAGCVTEGARRRPARPADSARRWSRHPVIVAGDAGWRCARTSPTATAGVRRGAASRDRGGLRQIGPVARPENRCGQRVAGRGLCPTLRLGSRLCRRARARHRGCWSRSRPRRTAVVGDVRAGALAGAPLELLAATLGELRRLQAQLEWLSLQVVREVDVSGSHVADGALTPRAWLRQRARMSSSEATSAVRTARALGSGLLDATSRALAEGEIDPAHARLIAKDALDAPAGAVALIEPIALDAARRVRPAAGWPRSCAASGTLSTPMPRTRRRCAGTSSAACPRRQPSTAWSRGSFLLRARVGSRVPHSTRCGSAAGEGRPAYSPAAPGGRAGRHRAALPLDRRRPAYLRRPAARDRDDDPRRTRTARRGTASRLSWVGLVPDTTAERIACDAQVTVVGVDTDGEARDLSQERRFFTWTQRMAMIARDGDQCPWPWCRRPISWSRRSPPRALARTAARPPSPTAHCPARATTSSCTRATGRWSVSATAATWRATAAAASSAPSRTGDLAGMRPPPTPAGVSGPCDVACRLSWWRGTGRAPARRTAATSTGTRSSTPWNMPEKSRSAGSRSGAKPKPRMPSRLNDLLSVPPDRQYGHGARAGVLGLQRRDHRVDERAVEGRLERDVAGCTVSRRTSGPSSSSMVASSSSSKPGRKRQSMNASRGLRDDVVLVAGLEHRRVGGVAQRGADDPGERAELGQRRLRVRRVDLDAERVGHLLEERAAPSASSASATRARPIRATASASAVTALSSLTIEPCPARPVGDQPQPGDALLRGLDQVDAAGRRDGEREAADLADRLGDALEQLGVVVDQPVRARACRRPPRRRGSRGRRRAAACGPRGAICADERQHHRVHVLHVDGAAAPDAAVGDLAGERVVPSSPAASAGTTSRWPCTSSAGAAGVLALEPRPRGWSGPARDSKISGSSPTSASCAGDVLRRRPLPRPAAVAVVGRVDPDQVAADLDDLVLRARDVGAGLGHGASYGWRGDARPSPPRAILPHGAAAPAAAVPRALLGLLRALRGGPPGRSDRARHLVRVAELADALA